MEEAPPTVIDDEEVQPDQPQEVPQEETPVENPTKDVKTFWNRLDEVLTELESERPIVTRPYTSSLFQPERVSISSTDAIPNYPTTIYDISANVVTWHQNSETFSQFTVKFDKALINVKSLQCLSAIIPNVTLNIPDSETYFYYYRIASLQNSIVGAWNSSTLYVQGNVVTSGGSYYVAIVNNLNTAPPNPLCWYNVTTQLSRPNYYQLKAANLKHVNMLPSEEFPVDFYSTANQIAVNRTFTSYQDLVDTLNVCASAATGTASIPGDVSFEYDSAINKIVLVPTDTTDYFYMAAGFVDPNVVAEQRVYAQNPSKTLNLRCGFTWNGVYVKPTSLQNPFTSNLLMNSLAWYLRPTDPNFPSSSNPLLAVNDTQTANSYGNLVNTSCVKVYCNITMGSTQDSNGNAGLLTVVPINAANGAVGYYQNNFNNPLTKVPEIITDIQILLVSENGEPFYLPNSAVVTLELYVLYK
jgi:hypothetical protein